MEAHRVWSLERLHCQVEERHCSMWRICTPLPPANQDRRETRRRLKPRGRQVFTIIASLPRFHCRGNWPAVFSFSCTRRLAFIRGAYEVQLFGPFVLNHYYYCCALLHGLHRSEGPSGGMQSLLGRRRSTMTLPLRPAFGRLSRAVSRALGNRVTAIQPQARFVLAHDRHPTSSSCAEQGFRPTKLYS